MVSQACITQSVAGEISHNIYPIFGQLQEIANHSFEKSLKKKKCTRTIATIRIPEIWRSKGIEDPDASSILLIDSTAKDLLQLAS